MKTILALLKKHVSLLKILTLLVTLSASTNFASAQNQTEKVTPKSSIWYYEYLPPDYASNTNNYPIVFFLHGLGERGDDKASLVNVAKNGPPKYVKAGYKFPFILISPQLKQKYTGWPANYMSEVIDYCVANLRVDKSRIYLTGLSLGGGGTWGYAQDPILNQKLAAIAVVCGHQNNPAKACNIVAAGIPVWGFHGDADGTVNYNKTVSMVKALNLCVPAPNPAALITIYPGVGHNAWDNAYRTDHSLHNPNVYEWLLQFKNGGIKVDAGADIALNIPTTSTNISGTASADSGPITTYLWTKVSGPAATLSNPATTTLSLTNLVAGVYTFRLTASNLVETAYDDVLVSVTAANQAPSANAGLNVNLTLPTNAVNLNGSGTDNDGTIATYAWAKVSGPTATMTGQATATLSLSALLQGTYVFSLTVKDNSGATSTDEVTVVVNAAIVNQAPTANAGLDKDITLPTNSTNLTGSGSDPDGTIASYLWEKVSGPTVTLTNATSTTVSLSALVEGEYVFQLTVKDNKGAIGTDQVSVSVDAANQSPTANAGLDIVLTDPTSTTTINGSGTDPEGKPLTYAWTQVSGPVVAPPVALENITSATLTVKNLKVSAQAYVFRLTVTDNLGSTGFDDVKVTVNAAPVNVPPSANAGVDKSITLPLNTITINGSGTDTDGTVTGYAWTKISGPGFTPVNANTSSLTANDLIAGTYTFRLTVTDNQTATHFDDVIITVQPAAVNTLPVASAGNDIVKTLPDNSATLSGSGTDADGTVTTYAWTKLTGPAATFSGAASATLELTNLVAGIYSFQLTVTDDKGATDTDDVQVTVNVANTPPTALAGMDIIITSPASSTIINGSGTDTDGTITGFAWSQVTALPSTATLTDAATNTLSVSDLIEGTYTFRLTVTDDDGDTGTDDVKVIVNAAANQSPTASAGLDKNITLPTNTANFTGSGTDPDGTIASYVWTQVGGIAATLSNETTQTLTVSIVSDGSYTFRLTVTDDDGASDFDDVILNVSPEALNQPPTASVGGNQSITLPINSLNLTGSGSDSDGSIASYLWTKISGPTAILANETSSTVSLSNLVEGTYTFRLTVTDDDLASNFAEVTVTVLPAAVNQPPTANAGLDKILTLPTDNITLFGTGSDPDGTVITYSWSQLSGPVTDPDGELTGNLILSALAAGTYSFELLVTDEKGATATDQVTVTVNAIAANQAPTAKAGADKTITLPTNILTLSGAGSDADGTIVGYLWAKVSGPTVTLGALNQSALSLSNLLQGTYKFRLEVRDDDGASDIDDVIVKVLPAAVNKPPVVTVDGDKEIFLPVNTVSVDGVASDADGSIKSLVWIQVNGPSQSDLVNSTSSSLTANNLEEGVYTFRLTATDNSNATAFDEIKVTVNAATVNQPPTVNAGLDKSIKLPTNNTTLTASGSDPDGTIASYNWQEISGPSCNFTPSDNPLAINNMVEGVYQFKVTVTDNAGAEASDIVKVTVFPAALNLSPIASAGDDVSLQLPENTTTLTGSFTDDGTTSTVSWSKVSGPTATLNDATTNTLSLSNLVEGDYVFRFTVNDNDPTTSLSDFDDVAVKVFPADIPKPPATIKIEGDSLLELPDNAVKLTAVTESDGLLSYEWKQSFGPTTNINTFDSNILEASDLSIIGTYRYEVLVTDEANQETSSEFEVRVIAGPDNTFSPNGDNKFDTWTLGEPESKTDCEIAVYNRQGAKVYQSTGYSEPWNGTFNGKPLPEGVYFYVIRCPSKKAKTGSVTIIR